MHRDDGSNKINVYVQYCGTRKIGVILAVEDTKSIRKNELISFVQKLCLDESDRSDIRGQRTKRIVLDKLAKVAPSMVYVDKVRIAQK